MSAALVAIPAHQPTTSAAVSSTPVSHRRACCWFPTKRWRACARARNHTLCSTPATTEAVSRHHLGLAETGASGPTGNRYGDNYGHACVAVTGPVEKVITIETGDPDREANMWVFAERAFQLLEECIRESQT